MELAKIRKSIATQHAKVVMGQLCNVVESLSLRIKQIESKLDVIETMFDDIPNWVFEEKNET